MRRAELEQLQLLILQPDLQDEPVLVTGMTCPQCGMDAEIYRYTDGSVQCQVCGWYLRDCREGGKHGKAFFI